MAILTTGNSFSAGDQVDATSLNAAVNSAAFTSSAVDGNTTQLSSGAIIVKSGGIDDTRLSTGGPTWTTGGILQPGDITLTAANPEILGGDTDGVMYIAPSTTNALGGNILLYGDTHATKAKDIELRATAGVELHYDDSASTWDFQANKILTTGDVGIGTASPTELLHVRKDGTDATFTIFQSDLGANTRDFKIKTPTSDSLTEPFRFTTNNAFSFEIDSAEALRIADTGRVGIGETVPESLLHIKGGEGSALPALSASTYLIVEGTDGDAELSIIADATAGNSILNFGSEADEDTGEIKHDHSTGTMSLSSDGNTGLQISNAGDVTFPGDQIAISTTQTPASENATGVAGTICWDASYLYICRATNTWSRITHNWGA